MSIPCRTHLWEDVTTILYGVQIMWNSLFGSTAHPKWMKIWSTPLINIGKPRVWRKTKGANPKPFPIWWTRKTPDIIFKTIEDEELNKKIMVTIKNIKNMLKTLMCIVYQNMVMILMN